MYHPPFPGDNPLFNYLSYFHRYKGVPPPSRRIMVFLAAAWATVMQCLVMQYLVTQYLVTQFGGGGL